MKELTVVWSVALLALQVYWTVDAYRDRNHWRKRLREELARSREREEELRAVLAEHELVMRKVTGTEIQS